MGEIVVEVDELDEIDATEIMIVLRLETDDYEYEVVSLEHSDIIDDEVDEVILNPDVQQLDVDAIDEGTDEFVEDADDVMQHIMVDDDEVEVETDVNEQSQSGIKQTEVVE